MFSGNTIEQIIKKDTPFYYYDLTLLNKTIRNLKSISDKYGYHIHYAFKANTNQEIIEQIKQAGLGADCVSGNEVKFAIENGFSPQNIVFAGVGKNDQEINYALDNNIFCFNCESLQELEVINELASKKKQSCSNCSPH